MGAAVRCFVTAFGSVAVEAVVDAGCRSRYGADFARAGLSPVAEIAVVTARARVRAPAVGRPIGVTDLTGIVRAQLPYAVALVHDPAGGARGNACASSANLTCRTGEVLVVRRAPAAVIAVVARVHTGFSAASRRGPTTGETTEAIAAHLARIAGKVFFGHRAASAVVAVDVGIDTG